MNRIVNLENHMKSPLQWMKLDAHLGEEDQQVLKRVELFCEKELHTELFLDCYHKA